MHEATNFLTCCSCAFYSFIGISATRIYGKEIIVQEILNEKSDMQDSYVN